MSTSPSSVLLVRLVVATTAVRRALTKQRQPGAVTIAFSAMTTNFVGYFQLFNTIKYVPSGKRCILYRLLYREEAIHIVPCEPSMLCPSRAEEEQHSKNRE